MSSRTGELPSGAAVRAAGSARFIARRLVSAVVTLFAVSVLTFGLFFAIPADPAALQCGRGCTSQQVAQISAQLGLDRPIAEQYVDFMWGIVAGRTIGSGETAVECAAPCLGYSFRTFEPVTEMLKRSLPVTLSIVIGAVVLWLSAGVTLGVIAAVHRGTWIDKATIAAALVGASSQIFFVGLMLQSLLVFGLGWLPLPSYVSPFEDPWGWFGGMLLPWVTLAFVVTAAYTRLTRSQMLDALSEDFIRTARAKGLPRRAVLRQALRAAITPVVTIAGLDIGAVLGGVVITESVFGMPGLGKLSVQATQDLNLPVVMATVLLSAAFVVAANIVVDVLYAVIDPRVRLG